MLELALVFLRLGVTAFGGPAAHLAMMEEEVVRRRRWLTHEQFLDLFGATNLIPGPNSTEMAIHLGLVPAGIDRPAGGGRLLHSSGSPHRHRDRLGLCPLRNPAPGGGDPPRGESR